MTLTSTDPCTAYENRGRFLHPKSSNATGRVDRPGACRRRKPLLAVEQLPSRLCPHYLRPHRSWPADSLLPGRPGPQYPDQGGPPVVGIAEQGTPVRLCPRLGRLHGAGVGHVQLRSQRDGHGGILRLAREPVARTGLSLSAGLAHRYERTEREPGLLLGTSRQCADSMVGVDHPLVLVDVLLRRTPGGRHLLRHPDAQAVGRARTAFLPSRADAGCHDGNDR